MPGPIGIKTPDLVHLLDKQTWLWHTIVTASKTVLQVSLLKIVSLKGLASDKCQIQISDQLSPFQRPGSGW